MIAIGLLSTFFREDLDVGQRTELRKEDLEEYLKTFLCDENQLLDKKNVVGHPTPTDLRLVNQIMNFSWPGNELEIHEISHEDGTYISFENLDLAEHKASVRLAKLNERFRYLGTNNDIFQKFWNSKFDLDGLSLCDLSSIGCNEQVTVGAMDAFVKVENKRLITSNFYCLGSKFASEIFERPTYKLGEWIDTHVDAHCLVLLLLPILTHQHWRLVVLNRNHKRIDYLDSAKSEEVGFEEVRHTVQNFKCEAARLLGIEFKDYDLHYCRVPKQPADSVHCGFYVMYYIKAWDGDKFTHPLQSDVPLLRYNYMCQIINELQGGKEIKEICKRTKYEDSD